MHAAYPLGPLARYSPYLLLKYHCHLNVEVHKYYFNAFKYLYVAVHVCVQGPGDVGSFL